MQPFAVCLRLHDDSPAASTDFSERGRPGAALPMRLDGAALRVSLHTLNFVRKLQRRAALSSARFSAPEASAAEQPDDGASGGEASRHASNDDAVPTADLGAAVARG
jgi:hypothetical protein